jgi:hypothetical protein
MAGLQFNWYPLIQTQLNRSQYKAVLFSIQIDGITSSSLSGCEKKVHGLSQGIPTLFSRMSGWQHRPSKWGWVGIRGLRCKVTTRLGKEGITSRNQRIWAFRPTEVSQRRFRATRMNQFWRTEKQIDWHPTLVGLGGLDSHRGLYCLLLARRDFPAGLLPENWGGLRVQVVSNSPPSHLFGDLSGGSGWSVAVSIVARWVEQGRRFRST